MGLGGHRLSAEGARLLLSHSWLARMPADFQNAVLRCAIWYQAEPGRTFIRAGDEQGGMFGIASGSANVGLGEGHPDTAALHIVGAGFWAGYRPLLGRSRNINLVARTQVLWALIPQAAMAQMLSENAGWWQHLMQLSEDNMEMVASALADLTLRDTAQRAIAVLLRLANCRSPDALEPSSVCLRVTQNELAEMAVMSRNTLRTVVQNLIDADLVEIRYRSLRLKDAAKLRAMLEAT